jgi:N-acetylglucosamine kinase-like BadF-type ATPase
LISAVSTKNKMKWILALEGGGTRSQAVLVDPTGRVCGIGYSRDVNTNFTPLEEARAAVRGAASDALNAAGTEGEMISVLVSALVGPQFGIETFGDLFPRASYRYYNEAQVVFARGGVYRPHGLALVAATGATAWGVRVDDGRWVGFGGWGSLLGDEGSAHALGIGVLRAAPRAWEGRLDQPTRLPEALALHFGFDPADFRGGMVQRAYHPTLTRSEIAALAPLATRLAAEGDVIAARLVAKTAADLCSLALHAARSLFTSEECFDLVAAGGLFNAGEMIVGPLRAAFAHAYPRVELRIGIEAPAIAVANLARFDMKDELEELC